MGVCAKVGSVLAHVPHVLFTVFLMLWADDVVTWDFWIVFIPLWIEYLVLLVALIALCCCSSSSSQRAVPSSMLAAGARYGDREAAADAGDAGAGSSRRADALAAALLAVTLLVFSVLLAVHATTSAFSYAVAGIPLYVLGVVAGVAAFVRPTRTRFPAIAIFSVPAALLVLLVSLRLDGVIIGSSWFVIFLPVWIFFAGFLVLMCCVACCTAATMPQRRFAPILATGTGTQVALVLVALIPALLFAIFVALRLDALVDWAWARIFIPLFIVQVLAVLFTIVSPTPAEAPRTAYSEIQ